MALLKQTLRMLVLAAMATASALSWADQPYHPFAEPMSYDPDWQFFAPVDIQEMADQSARQRANYGWYLTYDRVQIALDRPIIEPQSDKLDRGWGNLWTFGVMTEEDSGWDFQFLHITGPNTYDTARSFRPTFLANDADPPDFPLLLERVEFDPAFGNGTYQIRDSLNVASLGSFEINKKWRRSPYQFGGFLEPMIGIRYIDFTDTNVADGYSQGTLNLTEQFDISTIVNENRMVLGQVGFRYFRDIGRFQFSTEFKALGGGNFQTGSVDTRRYVYNLTNPDPTTWDIPIFRLTEAPGLENKMLAGLDTRVQLSYNLTRKINFRAGLSMLYIGSGIARGSQIRGNVPTPSLTNPPIFGPSAQFVQQNLVMPGVSLGITINR